MLWVSMYRVGETTLFPNHHAVLLLLFASHPLLTSLLPPSSSSSHPPSLPSAFLPLHSPLPLLPHLPLPPCSFPSSLPPPPFSKKRVFTSHGETKYSSEPVLTGNGDGQITQSQQEGPRSHLAPAANIRCSLWWGWESLGHLHPSPGSTPAI